MFDTKLVEQVKTQVLSPRLLPEDSNIYEIMWKNMGQSDRPIKKI